MILGAIFAGGQARRFGSDKAAVRIDGVALLDRVARALAPQCAALVVVGRDWPGLASVEDVPTPGMGPLGALAGALAHAQAHGFAEVLTAGCDLPDVPQDFASRLSPAPAVIAGQPLLGLWPSRFADRLRDHLLGDRDRAMRAWIAETSARRVELGGPLANINTPADLAAYEAARR